MGAQADREDGMTDVSIELLLIAVIASFLLGLAIGAYLVDRIYAQEEYDGTGKEAPLSEAQIRECSDRESI